MALSKVWHTSGETIRKPTKRPMWFAIEKSHAIDGWSKNIEDEGGVSYIYESRVKGNIADYDDSKINNMFDDAGVDIEEYTIEIAGNPSEKQLMAEAGTKLLIENGYDGIVYNDYDPRDWNKDLKAVVIFDPTKSLSGWKQIK